MKSNGLLDSNSEKPGSRPEKIVYSITEKGVQAFSDKLVTLLKFDYRPTFSADSVFFFFEYQNRWEIIEQLKKYREKLKQSIEGIDNHRTETLQFVPEDRKGMVNIVFSHHLKHYEAELAWATETLNELTHKEGLQNDKTKNH